MKSAIIFLIIIINVSVIRAQEADQRINELLAKADWFALDEEYPALKNKIRSGMLKGLSEALLAKNFNQPARAHELIDSLIVHCQGEMIFETTCYLVLCKSQIYGEHGYYAQSADYLNNFLDQITAFAKKDDFPGHVYLAKHYGEMQNEPAPEVIRPEKDTEIAMEIKTIEKNSALMYVPVVVRGKTYRFVFDTGAGSTFVSDRFADEIGLRIVRDSVTITGVGTCLGKIGTMDSLIIGDIIFKNPMIYIAPPTQVDTTIYFDAILGLDFIRRIGETRIFPKDGKILFPRTQTTIPSTDRNLLINGQPYIKAYSGNEQLIFHFDTGNASANLCQAYYLKHKDQIESVGVKEKLGSGGLCEIRMMEGYRLPEISLKTGSTSFSLANINVYTDKAADFEYQEDGALGMDFIKQFRKVIINFDQMFVEVER